MEKETFLLSVVAILISLGFATLIHLICRYIKLAFSVGLLFGGIFLAFLTYHFSTLHIFGTKFNVLQLFEHFQFSPEIVFYIFLPTLIFESSYNLNFRQLKGVWGEVALLSTLGMLVSAFFVAYPLHYFTGINLPVALIFGALISATDPVAVLAIFKELKAPKKLSTIVDGESLVNDGTGLILFNFISSIFITGTIVLNSQTLLKETGNFFISLIEGFGIGFLFGFIFTHAISKAKTKGVQVTLSLILAHITFIFADKVLEVSGILATLSAGLVVGNYGMRKLTNETRHTFAEIWEFMGFVANSLIFILLGMKLFRADLLSYWKLILISAFVVIFISRPISVYLSFIFSNLFRNVKSKISFRYQTIIFWGGLRGAIAATAVLLVPEDYDYFSQLLAMTAGTIIATFILNATTIPFLLKKLKFVDFTMAEKIQKLEAKILINEQMRNYLEEVEKKDYFSKDVLKKIEKKYLDDGDKAIINLQLLREKLGEKSDREIEKILTYYTLEIERKCYKNLLEQNEISDERFCVLNESILRQIDRLENDELPNERTSPIHCSPDIPKNFALLEKLPKNFIYNFLQIFFEKYQKKQIMAKMQHYRARRVSSLEVMHDLKDLINYYKQYYDKRHKNHLENDNVFNSNFKELIVLDKIFNRYKDWHENAQEKIEKLESDFPKIVIPKRIKMAQDSCLNKEYEYEKMFCEKGLITEKVFRDLEKEFYSQKSKI